MVASLLAADTRCNPTNCKCLWLFSRTKPAHTEVQELKDNRKIKHITDVAFGKAIIKAILAIFATSCSWFLWVTLQHKHVDSPNTAHLITCTQVQNFEFIRFGQSAQNPQRPENKPQAHLINLPWMCYTYPPLKVGYYLVSNVMVKLRRETGAACLHFNYPPLQAK